MLEAGFYNMDCMEGMKHFPDKFFDLAIVDPPYGDGGQKIGGATVRRMVRPVQGGTDSGRGSTDTSIRSSRIPRGGWHGKDKYHLGKSPEPEEPGLRSTAKKS